MCIKKYKGLFVLIKLASSDISLQFLNIETLGEEGLRRGRITQSK